MRPPGRISWSHSTIPRAAAAVCQGGDILPGSSPVRKAVAAAAIRTGGGAGRRRRLWGYFAPDARAHAQLVADLHLFKRDFLFLPVLVDDPRGLRGEIEQRPDCRARALAGAKFHHLAEQDQNDDHRASFKINPNPAV